MKAYEINYMYKRNHSLNSSKLSESLDSFDSNGSEGKKKASNVKGITIGNLDNEKKDSTKYIFELIIQNDAAKFREYIKIMDSRAERLKKLNHRD
jgi:hypothetical protein